MKLTRKLLAGATVAGLLLTACGANGGSGGTPSTIDLWMPPNAANNLDKELWDEIVKPFEEKHNVDVNVTIVPWDSYETKYLTGISSGKGPDVGYMYSEMMGDYLVKDQLVALDEKVTDAQRKNLLFLDKGVINGKQYALPSSSAAHGCWSTTRAFWPRPASRRPPRGRNSSTPPWPSRPRASSPTPPRGATRRAAS